MSQQQQQVKRTPLPRRKACQACSQAKVRCDHKAEGCSRCEVRGVRCVYPGGRTSRAREDTSSAGPGEGAARPPAVDDSRPSEFDRQPEPSGFGENAGGWPTPETRSLSGLNAASQHWLDGPTITADGSHGTTTSQQTSPELLCTIEPGAIQNRWLKAFIPDVDQRPKVSPPATHEYVDRMLKAHTSGLIRHGTLPPFAHKQQLEARSEASPLHNCINLAKLCAKGPACSEALAIQLFEQEMAKIDGLKSTYHHADLLAAFQAYLIYVMTLYFHLGQKDSPALRQYMMNLQQLACDTCSRGVACSSELDHTRPRWSSWIIAESIRRTLYTMYLFDNLLCVNDDLPVFVGTELAGLPAPAGKHLWRAPSEEEWKAAYNMHLADWNNGGLRLDELWRVPDGATPEAVALRRERIDQWLEDVDEYGVFLYAVTSCTHGA
ncbi:uncharacterized protein LTR77_006943 [Saxophila tyrrhenica]|uniref:Zn(2)-C6 fungal-type domain-containing protein n=1 Tax=Saxophila tyrrhenica TaxID=1690608 RepID=A0AAV9P945_9PEZI|nr:hypothetical protein LTR77_006943 [Saxophila tyrrhenica]